MDIRSLKRVAALNFRSTALAEVILAEPDELPYDEYISKIPIWLLFSDEKSQNITSMNKVK